MAATARQPGERPGSSVLSPLRALSSQSLTHARGAATTVQDTPHRANVGVDLVINRIGKPSGKHPMKSPDLCVDTGVRRERIDIREKRVKEVVADLIAVLRVEGPAPIKVLECGFQYPQLHRSICADRALQSPSPLTPLRPHRSVVEFLSAPARAKPVTRSGHPRA
jgi:hypothetical protein